MDNALVGACRHVNGDFIVTDLDVLAFRFTK